MDSSQSQDSQENNEIHRDPVDSEDAVSLKALSDEDLAYIAKNPIYRAMLQDLISPIIEESGGGHTSADNTSSSSRTGRGTDTTRSREANRVPDQHADESDESEAEEQSDQDTATIIVEKICHALGKRKKSTLTASKRQKEGEGEEPRLFDPSLDREDKDEYKFDPPKVVTKYLEQHFRKGLAKDERTAMLKKHPKPNTKVMVPPKLDSFVSEFAPKKVDKAIDVALSKIQGSLLYAVNPLANLWTGLIEQGLADEPQALIPVPDVLDIIQRSIVLIGNSNNLVSETRREVALEAIHSSLKKYAKGDFKDADSDLFGEKFKEELVKKVEADGALSKVVGIVSRSSKIYQTPQNQNKGKSPLFHNSRASGYGAAFGRRQSPYTGHSGYYGSHFKGKFTPGKPYFKKGNVFDRLGHKGGNSNRPADQHN